MNKPRPHQPGEAHCVVLRAFVVLLLFSGMVHGQLPEDAGGDTPSIPSLAPDEPGVAKERQPRIFYLRDKDGNLVPVPGLSLEDFRRLWDLDQKIRQPQAQPPPYVVNSLEMEGKISQQTARLDVVVKLSVQRDGWVRIPLRFHDAILTSPVKHAEGEGEIVMEFQRTGEGLVCWLNGKKETAHSLSFELSSPLQQLESETRFHITAPTSLISSIRLQLPPGVDSASVADQAGVYVPMKIADGAVNYQGLDGTVQLSWSKGAAPTAQAPLVIESSGEIMVTVLPGGRLRADADLTVRSYGGAMSSLQVSVPPGMRWLPQNADGYSVEPLQDAGEATSPQELMITLRQPTAGPFPIHLQAISAPRRAGESPWLEAGGFQVLGASRQGGFVNVRAEGDAAVQWNDGPNVFRVDKLPSQEGANDVVARFEYVSQPYTLRLQTAARRTRIHVEPLYILYIDDKETQLVAKFKFQVRGLEADQLQVEMGGWTVDRILPTDVPDAGNIQLDKTTPLTIPLSLTARQGAGDLQITIQAHKTREAQSGEVDLVLPKPIADAVGLATIAVSPAVNVEIIPWPEKMEGLLEETLPPPLELKPGQQAPLFFRERGDADRARFVAKRRDRQQELFVSLANQVQINDQNAVVEQRLLYRIEYEPTDRLQLDVPRRLFQNGGLKVFLDETAVRLHELTVEAQDPGEAREPGEVQKPADITEDTHIRAFVELFSEQRIGSHQLTVHYTVPLPYDSAGHPAAQVIPLAVPAREQNITVTSNRLEATFPDSLRVSLSDDKWISLEPGQSAAGTRSLSYTSDVAVRGIPLSIREVEARHQNSTTVKQVWLQTWLTARQRRDRAVFRVATDEQLLQVQLPPGAELVNVALNGREAHCESSGDSQHPELEIALFSPQNRNEYVLEIWYLSPRQAGWFSAAPLQLPQVFGADRSMRFFWQIVAPANEHLIGFPPDLTAEMDWRRQGLIWGPRANRGQQELERWIGAIPRAEIAQDSTNQYLFSGYGLAEQVQARMASRVALVFVASSLALGLGLVWLYCRAARKPLIVFTFGVILVSAGLLYPEPTQLALQAGVWGAVLALSAFLLNRWLAPRPASPAPLSRSSSLIRGDSKTMHGPLLHRESDPQSTTANAAIYQESTAEPNP